MTKCIPEDIEIHSNIYGDEYSFINSIHRSSNYFLYHLSIHWLLRLQWLHIMKKYKRYVKSEA